MAITLQELLVKISADVSSYTAGMQGIEGSTAGVEGSVAKLGGSLDTLTSGLDKLGSSLTRVGGMLTAAITVPLAGVSIAALKVAGDLEQAKVAFTTLLGSVDAAQKHLEALRDFSLKTPFEFGDLVKASQKLQALGFSADKVIPTLTAIGNAAAGLGMGAEGIDRITLALGQMQAKGKVSAQEMNQLAEAGIGAWDMLAAAISRASGKTVTVAETMKMAEKGMLDGASAVQVLLEGMESRFGGLMDQQSQTLLGMFSNLKDNLSKVLSQIGDSLAPLAKSLIQDVTNMLPVISKLVDSFTSLPEPVQKAALAFAAISAAMGPIILVAGQFTTSIASVLKAVEAFSAFTAGTGLFAGFTAQAGAATTAVGGVSGALTALMGLAAPIASLFSGAFIGLAQLHGDTANLRSLNDEFEKFLVSKTQAFTGPLAPGVGAFDAGIKAINDALEKGLIDLDKYNKLMSLLNANMDKLHETSPEQLKEFGAALSSGLNIKLPKGAVATPGSASDAAKSLIRVDPEQAKKDAEKAAHELQQQFSNIGVKDLQKQIDDAVKSFNSLRAAGKLTGDQMLQAAGHIAKLREELKGLTSERIVLPAIDPQGLLGGTQNIKEALDTAIGNWIDKLADRLRELPLAVSQAFQADTLAAGNTNLEVFNNLLLNTAVGFEANKSKAQDFFDTLNENLGLSREQLQGLEDQVNKASALKFFGLTQPAELRQNAEAAQANFDILVKTHAPAQQLLEIMGKMRDAQTALTMATEAYNAGLINAYQLQTKQLAALQETVRKQQDAGQNVTLEQSKQIYEMQQQQAKAMVDVWKDVHNEVSQAIDSIGVGLARGILDVKNFGSEMKRALSSVLEGVFTDVFKTITKPLTDWLKDTITNAIAPIASKIASSLGLTAVGSIGGAAAKAGVQGLSAAEQAGATAASQAALNNVLGVGSSAASAATSAATSAAGGIGQAAGALSSAANIANIANAGISLVSGIVSGLQNAAMNKSLDLIEHSTRYTQIILQEIKDGAGKLPADMWTLHGQLLEKLDSVADTFATWIQDLEQVVRGLSMAPSSGPINSDAVHADLVDIATAVREVTQTLKAGTVGAGDKPVVPPIVEDPGTSSIGKDLSTLHRDLTQIDASLSDVNKNITVGLRGSGENAGAALGEGIHRDMVAVTGAVDKVEKSVREGLAAVTDAVKAGPKATQNPSLERSGGSASGGRTSGGLNDAVTAPIAQVVASLDDRIKAAISQLLASSSIQAFDSLFNSFTADVQDAISAIVRKSGHDAYEQWKSQGGDIGDLTYKPTDSQALAALKDALSGLPAQANLTAAAAAKSTSEQSGVPSGLSGFSGSLPSDIGLQTAMMTVNQTCAMGFAAVLEQLKSMTSLSGGGGSTGAAGANAGDFNAILKTALSFTASPEEQANNAIAAAYKTPNTEFYTQRALNALSEAFSASSVDSLVSAVNKLPPGAKEIAQSAIGSIDKNATDALSQLQNTLSNVSQDIVDNAQQAAGSISNAGQDTAAAVLKVASTISDLPPTLTDLQKQLVGLGYSVEQAMNAITQPGARLVDAGVSGGPDVLTDIQKQLLEMGFSMDQVMNAVTMPGARPYDSGMGAQPGVDDPFTTGPYAYHQQAFDPNWQDKLQPFVPDYYMPPVNYSMPTGTATPAAPVNINIYGDVTKETVDYMKSVMQSVV